MRFEVDNSKFEADFDKDLVDVVLSVRNNLENYLLFGQESNVDPDFQLKRLEYKANTVLWDRKKKKTLLQRLFGKK